MTLGFAVLAAVPGSKETLGFVMAPLCLLMTWRSWLMGIRADATGVKVVGFLASKRVRWQDIDHFEVLPAAGWPFVGHVILRNGKKIFSYGISTSGRPKSRYEAFRREAQKPIDQLNKLLAEQREI